MKKYPDFEEICFSKTAESIYKIGHHGVRMMKWLVYYGRCYYENMNQYNLMTSVLICLKDFIQINHFNKIIIFSKARKLENSRRCDVWNNDIHRASYAKNLRSKNHLKNKNKVKCLYQNGCLKKSKHMLKKV